MTLSGLAEKIWRAGLSAVEPARLVRDCVSREGNTVRIHPGLELALSDFENVFLLAFGKAAPAMSSALLEILGDRIRGGVIVVLPGQRAALPGVCVLEAPHPLPDERSVAAGRAIVDLARGAGPNDLIILFVSGGGSAQACYPAAGLSLADKRRTTEILMRRGADIVALNIVRKHLSAIKGGRLAEAAVPARVVTLAISDVIGDDLEAIASGPAHWDSSTFEDAAGILRGFGDDIPRAATAVIEAGRSGRIPETPKEGHPAFRRVTSRVIGNNALALEAARREAERLGFRTFVLTSSDRGEAKRAARSYVSLLLDILLEDAIISRPVALLAGGELTVKVQGGGRGGRNQEFALAALVEIERQVEAREAAAPALRARYLGRDYLGDCDWLVASLGTDGLDGNTEAAGARISSGTVRRARSLGLDAARFLEENDSYSFFKRAGGLIVTGPTGTNVMDMRLVIVAPGK